MGLKISSLNLTRSKERKNMNEDEAKAVNDDHLSAKASKDSSVSSTTKEEIASSNNNNEDTQPCECSRDSSDEQIDGECEGENSTTVSEFDNASAPTNSDDVGFEVKSEQVVNYKSKSKASKTRNKKKKTPWVLKFNCARLKNSSSSSCCSDPEIPDKETPDSCVCTGYRKTENSPSKVEEAASAVPVFQCVEPNEKKQSRRKSQSLEPEEESSKKFDSVGSTVTSTIAEPVIDLSKFNPEDYPIEDCDERARLERAREIAEGVDPPPGFSPKQIELVSQADLNVDNLKALFHSALSLSALSQIDVPKSVHTQIDYIHCLVPDLLQITSCSFYWGKIDRYEAERLLENKPEGTFLLRDSAQEEYLFSVSFRKYDRSLHARIEQWNHRFSFDSHDPGVFASPTVCGLIEHYKDPSYCMFFEPMLTIPLHRNFTFSLQHLCRAVICDHLTYDSISYLKLPKTLKTYLKEYHYKQRVRVRKFDSEP